MKNTLKLSVLCAALMSGLVCADETKTAAPTFPEFLYKCYNVKYPCQVYADDGNGELFAYVKIDMHDPYVIQRNNILEFRGIGYVIEDVQIVDQEDFDCVIPGLISVKLVPYDTYVAIKDAAERAAVDRFCPFSLGACSSHSDVKEVVRRTRMIEGLDGFIYLITKDDVYECSTVGPVHLADIIENITFFKRLTTSKLQDGYKLGMNGYLVIRCLQKIDLHDSHLMRTNFYQKVHADLREDRLVNIIVDKDLVVLPEVGTVMSTTSGKAYRLKSVKALKTNDDFLVLTLEKLTTIHITAIVL